MPVAWNAQVIGAANIRAKFECMVAAQVRPVIDELNLALIFAQRAIACRDVERITEIEPGHTVDKEGRHAARKGVIIEARNANIFGRRGLRLSWINVHAITIEAEPEIGQPI